MGNIDSGAVFRYRIGLRCRGGWRTITNSLGM
jgi:hypothetical protein